MQTGLLQFSAVTRLVLTSYGLNWLANQFRPVFTSLIEALHFFICKINLF